MHLSFFKKIDLEMTINHKRLFLQYVDNNETNHAKLQCGCRYIVENAKLIGSGNDEMEEGVGNGLRME